MGNLEDRILELSHHGNSVSVEDVRVLIKDVTAYFRNEILLNTEDKDIQFAKKQITKLSTKFRDAGRRSPPWTAASSIVPGRPQDGEDGNRRSRWQFEANHKFYASEIDATLIEIKYFLQTLSMEGAPASLDARVGSAFIWLTGHNITPGEYLDPIQLIPISFNDFFNDARACLTRFRSKAG